MARESTTRVGSGVQVFRETASPPLIGMLGDNTVVCNYEDINSMLGVIQTSGLIVTNSAVHLTGPATRLRGRRTVLIQNRGPQAVYVGGAASVTVSTGYGIPHSGSLQLNALDYGHIFVVSEGVSDIRILEMR